MQVLFVARDHVLQSSDDTQRIVRHNNHRSWLQGLALGAVSDDHEEKGDAKAREHAANSQSISLFSPRSRLQQKRSAAQIKAGCSKRLANQQSAGAMQPMEQQREQRGTAGVVQSAHRAVVGKRVGSGVVALQSAGPAMRSVGVQRDFESWRARSQA